jgi:hypothetical protein
VKARWAVVVSCMLLMLGTSTHAFWTEEFKWAPGAVLLSLQQGPAADMLLDGSPDWDSVTEGALATWNAVLNGVALQPVRDPAATSGMPNGTNDVIWGDDVYGDPFGEGVLAITLSAYTTPDNVLVESDVIFNRKVTWNSYRGDVRRGTGGATVNDLRRVALHEFGHFIGLGHPDDHGQSVPAIMNSHIGNIDALQKDDVDGAAAIYGAVTPTDTLEPAFHGRSSW